MSWIDTYILGICEHCGKLLKIGNNFPEKTDEKPWHCPHCEEELSHRSFGFKKVDDKFSKTRLLGPDGNWINNPYRNKELWSSWKRFVLAGAERLKFRRSETG